MTRDYIALAAQYQADVLADRIPACKWVKLACARNRRDLDRQDTDAFPFKFDSNAGSAICRFGELLPYVSGRGFDSIIGHDELDRPVYKKFELQPWQLWFLTTLFGWKNAAGLRRFRVFYFFVPRKNGKSNLCAIIALYMLTEEREPGAQVVSSATSRDQAKNIAQVAWEMTKRSPAFQDHYGVKLGSETTFTLKVPSTASKFMPVSADANTLDGLNINCGLNDEFQNHPTASVWNVIDTATSARQQPLIGGIGTAGETFGGICHSKLAYLEKILDGVAVDEAVFGVNYTIDVDDDIRLPVIQHKANPNYGVSVQPADLERKINEAQTSHEALNNVLIKHFNVWLRSESAWMIASVWNTCATPGLTLESLAQYPCYIGVDLGETRDPSSLALLFKLTPETYAFIPRIYMPAAVVAKSPIAQTSGWTREGFIIETPGNEADYARIKRDLHELVKTLKVQQIDFDRRSARLMMQDLRTELEPSMGRDRVETFVLDIPQSIDTMDPAMKTTEALVLGRKLQHDGNPAMAWMISNIVVERDHKGQIYPRKAGGKDSPNKIDGPVSLFTALSQAMQAREYQPEYQILMVGGAR